MALTMANSNEREKCKRLYNNGRMWLKTPPEDRAQMKRNWPEMANALDAAAELFHLVNRRGRNDLRGGRNGYRKGLNIEADYALIMDRWRQEMHNKFIEHVNGDRAA